MIDSVRLKWVIARLAKGRGARFLELADRVVELHPGERGPSKPAIFPPEERARILQLAPWRSWEIENALINGEAITHGPTLAYELSDVGISGAYLYKGASRGLYGAGKAPFWGRPKTPWQEIDKAELVTCRVGAEHFGHFMWDNLPMELLPGPAGNPIVLQAHPRWHEESYRQVLDMPAPPIVHRGFVRRLTIYSDVGQNRYRAERYRQLRARVRRALAANDRQRDLPGVFVLRSCGGERRKMVNEREVADYFQTQGFRVIDPDQMTGEEIAEASLDARIVVGVEGSHVAHVLFTIAAGGIFWMLQPPERFSMVYKEFTDRMDMTYACLVGDSVSDGFKIDLDRIKALHETL